jgi:hypothetical protein
MKITKIKLKSTDTLILNVKRHKMPKTLLEIYMSTLQEVFKNNFPNNNIIILSDDVTLSILKTKKP